MSRIAIIGAGIGGCGCAGLLAREGHEVDVFERNTFIGGKCSAFIRDGYHADWGVHGFARGGAGPHKKISDLVGGRLVFISPDPIALVIDNFNGRIRRYHYPLHIRRLLNRVRMGLNMGVKPWNFLGGMRLFRILGKLDWGAIREWESHTVEELVTYCTDDEQTHRFMNMFCLLMFAQPYTLASAGEYIYIFSTMIEKGQGGYPVGGCNAITSAYLYRFDARGGRIHTQTPVRKIIVEDGQVVGIQTDQGLFEADIVISNAGIKNTLELVGKEAFSNDYWSRIHGMVDTFGVVTIKYALKSPVFEFPILLYIPDITGKAMFEFLTKPDGVPKDPIIFMPVITNFDPELAPPGTQLAIASTICTNEPGVDVDRIARILDERIKDLFPSVQKNLLWQHVTTQDDIKRISGRNKGDCIGLAQTPDQVGDKRPSPRLPIRGLYCVGADTGGRGVGTEMAAESALITVEMIRTDLQRPENT